MSKLFILIFLSFNLNARPQDCIVFEKDKEPATPYIKVPETRININEIQALKDELTMKMLLCSEDCLKECQTLNVSDDELVKLAQFDLNEIGIRVLGQASSKYIRIRYLLHVLKSEDDCQIQKNLAMDIYKLLLNEYKFPEGIKYEPKQHEKVVFEGWY